MRPGGQTFLNRRRRRSAAIWKTGAPNSCANKMSSRLSRVEDWEALARRADFHPGKLAAEFFVSQRQLQRFFRDHFHATPGQWLRQLQCRLARDLIERGYSNKAVAAELKFASPAHFCREFKKAFGNPPQAFASVKMSPPDNNVAHGQSAPVDLLKQPEQNHP